MGVSFIGNPFDQDNDNYDSDWEVNLDEEWVTAPQLVDVMDRTQFNLILAAETESSGTDDESDPNWLESNNDDDSDEDYIPDDDYISENDIVDMISEPDQFQNDSDESEDLDYVTYPTNGPVEPDKVTSDISDRNTDTD